jgi:hypothetical protein
LFESFSLSAWVWRKRLRRSKWTFELGHRQGKAVDVALTIEVDFDLKYE